MKKSKNLINQMKSKILSSSDDPRLKNIKWRSEENSDLWVLSVLNQKHNGTFIEAGAAGRSTCWNLEKYFGWHGVCIEPCTQSFLQMTDEKFLLYPWNQGIRKTVVNKCLYSHNGEVDFYDCEGLITDQTAITSPTEHWESAHLSSIKGKQRSHYQHYVEKYGKLVKKECVTLEQVIIDYKLPDTIDYLSMDIEDCESEVFSVFPFHKYKFLTMSIEEGQKHGELLSSHGYLMVENPYQLHDRNIDFFYIHKSIKDSYPYKFLNYEDYM